MKRNAFLLMLCLFLSASSTGQRRYEQSLLECEPLGYLEGQQCMIGSELPFFDVTTITEKQFNSSNVKGKIVVLNFWFMACPPCIAELQGLNQVVEKYKDRSDIVFLSFSLDSKDDLLRSFFPNHALQFEVVPEAQAGIFDVFKIKWGFPTSMVVDKAGRIHMITSGGSTDEQEASKNIFDALSGSIAECLEK